MLTNKFILVQSYSDGSGVISAFGPYDDEARAQFEKDAIQRLVDSGSEGKWEIIPIYNFGD